MSLNGCCLFFFIGNSSQVSSRGERPDFCFFARFFKGFDAMIQLHQHIFIPFNTFLNLQKLYKESSRHLQSISWNGCLFFNENSSQVSSRGERPDFYFFACFFKGFDAMIQLHQHIFFFLSRKRSTRNLQGIFKACP